jgi:uncharacterized protein (DUF1330 family)
MKAYAIGFLTAHSNDWQQEYGEKMPALTQKHGGKVIVRAKPTALEGTPAAPSVMVVIEFASADAAKAWYDDPDHARLKTLRQGGADFDMLLVEGLS